jgi:hypothetical protein
LNKSQKVVLILFLIFIVSLTILSYSDFNNPLAKRLGIKYQMFDGSSYFQDMGTYWNFIFVGSIVFVGLMFLFQKPKE